MTATWGVAETIALGKEAIPPLRELLFKREPSGLFETRRRAVEALASLGAYKTLVDFLKSSTLPTRSSDLARMRSSTPRPALCATCASRACSDC